MPSSDRCSSATRPDRASAWCKAWVSVPSKLSRLGRPVSASRTKRLCISVRAWVKDSRVRASNLRKVSTATLRVSVPAQARVSTAAGVRSIQGARPGTPGTAAAPSSHAPTDAARPSALAAPSWARPAQRLAHSGPRRNSPNATSAPAWPTSKAAPSGPQPVSAISRRPPDHRLSSGMASTARPSTEAPASTRARTSGGRVASARLAAPIPTASSQAAITPSSEKPFTLTASMPDCATNGTDQTALPRTAAAAASQRARSRGGKSWAWRINPSDT